MTILRNLIVLALSILSAFGMKALEIEAGHISEALNNTNLQTLKSLSISGTMDARDFKFIAENLESLSELDLSTVTIAEYSDSEPVLGNYVSYAANELPPTCFMGKDYEKVVLPSTLTSIGDCAFAGCRSLSMIELPSSLVKIGDMAFAGASSLSEIAGGTNVASVGDYAFSGCTQLASVSFPKMEKIGDYAFLQCSSISSLPFPETLEAVGTGAFRLSGIQTADLTPSKRLTHIGNWAFSDMPNLRSLKLPQALDSIANGLLFQSKRVETIEMGGNTTAIGDYAFLAATSIAQIQLPASTQYIGEGAFRNATGLRTLTVDAVVPPALGDGVWTNVAKWNVALEVPEMSVSAYSAADQWRDFFNAGVGDIDSSSRLTASFTNGGLTIHSSEKISTVTVFDLRGIMIARRQVNANAAEFDLSDYQGAVCIVRCELEGSVEYLKLGRN